MASGIVFDIQRFALHDGPGIRTTVFLKGCPLRCLWCHNPESQLARTQYSFDYAKCIKCQQEGFACSNGVTLVDGQIQHDRVGLDPANFAACPHDAITVVGREMTAAEVLAEVMRDKTYYRRSGGGLTISGGEPMQQFDFALALARGAKEAGLHVCLDTSGHASRERFAEIAPYVDIFLYDYKATDAEVHKELTRVGNEFILANLEFLCGLGAGIILRCPLIPGVNDTPEHLAGIADIARRYPNLLGVNVMAYHDFGNHKATRVGQQAPLAGLVTASEEQKQAWLKALHDLGCTVAKLG
jgi:pyruvate formate lyase activating enzyme